MPIFSVTKTKFIFIQGIGLTLVTNHCGLGQKLLGRKR